MRNIHYIKIWEEFVIPILNEEKTFEIRENDRGYNRGDLVVFKAIDKNGNNSKLFEVTELNKNIYEITYVLSDFHVDRNYVVFSFRKCIKWGI